MLATGNPGRYLPRNEIQKALPVMLSLFRSFAQSPFALVIIVLLVLAFALYGVGGIFTGSGTAVVVAGNQQVSVRELAQAYDRELRNMQTENPGFTREQAQEMGLGEQVLQRLTIFAALEAKADELGIAVSGDTLVSEAARQPAFRNPVTDQFDYDTMVSALQRAGLTEEQFRADMEGELRRQQIVSTLGSGLQVPRIYAETRFDVTREQRRITALILDASTADEIPDPTDEDLASFIDNNRNMPDPRTGLPLFMAPEMRAITLVRFQLDDFVRDVEIDEDVLRETYDYQVETGQIGTPALRSFVQVTAPDAETAHTVAERLASGEAADAIATELGLGEPVELAEVEAYEVPDSSIADAVFAMDEGETRAVQGRFGWNAVQVTHAEAASMPSFEEQRPALQEEAARADALDALYEQIAQFEQERAGGATLEQAAASSGSPIEIFQPLDRYGRDRSLEIDMARYQALGAEILPAAFEQAQGFANDLTQFNETDYYALRVDEIVPAQPRPLEEVRVQAETRWRQIQLDSQLQARANDAQGQLAAGESLDIVALTAGGRAESTTVRRGETAPNFPRNVVSRAFGLEPGQWETVQAGEGRYAIISVEDILPANLATASPGEIATLRDTISQDAGDDVFVALQQALSREYQLGEGAIDRRLAAQALGESPTAAQ